MALSKRGNTWRITIELGFDPVSGKRLRSYETFKGTRKHAQAREAELYMLREEGTFVAPSKLTVADYLTGTWLPTVKNNVRIRTYEGYSGIANKHIVPELGTIPLHKLRPLHIQNYLNLKAETGERNSKPLSARTLKHHYSVLRLALNRAVSLRLIAVNPALSVSSPKVTRKESQVLGEVQTAQLLKAAEGKELYVPLFVDAYTGLRRGELLGLRWEDISLDAGLLSVRRTLSKSKNGFRYGEPKSEKSKRTISISGAVVDVLRQHRKTQKEQKMLIGPDYEETGLVFCQFDGGPLGPRAFSAAFRKFEDGLDLPRIRLHDLRHGHCSHLLHAGVPLKLVSERLGHSSISITADLYGHIFGGQDRDAANLLDEVMKNAFAQVS